MIPKLLAVAICLCGMTVAAQEVNLLKRQAERFTTADRKSYLGYQVDRDTFETCEKIKLPIGDGKIEQAKQACPNNVNFPFNPIRGGRPIAGVVKETNPQARTFEIETDDGATVRFFVPKSSAAEAPWRAISNSKYVSVYGYTMLEGSRNSEAETYFRFGSVLGSNTNNGKQ